MSHPQPPAGPSGPGSSHLLSGDHNIVLLSTGSFSPTTHLHMRLMELARDWFRQHAGRAVIAGLLSPVHDKYNKTVRGLIESRHRLAMARLACSDSEWIKVDDWECTQDEYQRTVLVLDHVQKEYGGDVRVVLLCGADLLESFAVPDLWSAEDMRTILCSYGLAVVEREGVDLPALIDRVDVLRHHKDHIWIVQNWVQNDVSSTKIRNAIKAGHSIRYLVHDLVVDYISKYNLYT